MTVREEQPEIDGIIDRLVTYLSYLVSSQCGENGVPLRWQIGFLHANYVSLLNGGTFGTELEKCFTQASDANCKLEQMAYLTKQMAKETPTGPIATTIVQATIMYSLSVECRIVAQMTFASRDDVDRMMARLRTAFDFARDLAADSVISSSYEALTNLAGSITNHLYQTALPLPRVVTFSLGKAFPALYVSNRVYYDASRWEEFIAANNVVNPMFIPRTFRGLSD